MKNFLFILLCIFFVSHGTVIGAEIRTLEVEFAFAPPADKAGQLLGYKLYKDEAQVCETTDPSTSSITCNFSTDAGTFSFALSAYYSDNTDSPVSPAFLYTIEPIADAVPPQPPTAVIFASPGAGIAPLLVSFDAAASTTQSPPIVRYSWSFGDNSQATGEETSHLFTAPGTYHVELTIEDSSGLTDTTDIPVVVSEMIPPDQISNTPISTVNFNMEVGEVSIDHNWVRVLFENTFSQPVVIAGPPTFVGKSPALARIRNIDQTGFEIRLQEWDYQNDIHAFETVSFIVMEEGAYTLDDGSRIEAGRFTGLKKFHQVALQQSYSAAPIILTQVATEWDDDAVTGRIRNIGEDSFAYRLQEQQRTMKSHKEEEVGYIAWEPGQGTFAGVVFEAETTARKVKQKWFHLDFLTEFPQLPYLFTGIQTTNERDTATLRCKDMTPGGGQIKLQEEKSKDAETRHKKEVVGYLIISAANE